MNHFLVGTCWSENPICLSVHLRKKADLVYLQGTSRASVPVRAGLSKYTCMFIAKLIANFYTDGQMEAEQHIISSYNMKSCMT